MHVLSLRRVVACHGFCCNDFCYVYPGAASTAHTCTHSELKKGHFYFPALGTWTVVENKNGPFLWDNLLWNLICLGHREIHATGSQVELAGLGIDSLFYFRQNGFQFVYMISMSECQSCFLSPAKGDTIVIDTSGGCIKGARPFNKSNLMPPHEKNPLISCIQQHKSAAPNVRLDVGPAHYYY